MLIRLFKVIHYCQQMCLRTFEIQGDIHGLILHELDRPLPKRKNKKLIELMKDEFGGKNHEKICWIKSKNLQLLNT